MEWWIIQSGDRPHDWRVDVFLVSREQFLRAMVLMHEYGALNHNVTLWDEERCLGTVSTPDGWDGPPVTFHFQYCRQMMRLQLSWHSDAIDAKDLVAYWQAHIDDPLTSAQWDALGGLVPYDSYEEYVERRRYGAKARPTVHETVRATWLDEMPAHVRRRKRSRRKSS